VRAQAKFELPRGTIEPSLLSFSPEQRTRLDLFSEAGMEYIAIKNWDSSITVQKLRQSRERTAVSGG
jgi:hypothetical protein